MIMLSSKDYVKRNNPGLERIFVLLISSLNLISEHPLILLTNTNLVIQNMCNTFDVLK